MSLHKFSHVFQIPFFPKSNNSDRKQCKNHRFYNHQWKWFFLCESAFMDWYNFIWLKWFRWMCSDLSLFLNKGKRFKNWSEIDRLVYLQHPTASCISGSAQLHHLCRVASFYWPDIYSPFRLSTMRSVPFTALYGCALHNPLCII